MARTQNGAARSPDEQREQTPRCPGTTLERPRRRAGIWRSSQVIITRSGLILENASLHDFSNIRFLLLHDANRPLVNVSFALDYALWGARPFGFHLTNLLLHILNVLLLFRLARSIAVDGQDSAVTRLASIK